MGYGWRLVCTVLQTNSHCHNISSVEISVGTKICRPLPRILTPVTFVSVKNFCFCCFPLLFRISTIFAIVLVDNICGPAKVGHHNAHAPRPTRNVNVNMPKVGIVFGRNQYSRACAMAHMVKSCQVENEQRAEAAGRGRSWRKLYHGDLSPHTHMRLICDPHHVRHSILYIDGFIPGQGMHAAANTQDSNSNTCVCGDYIGGFGSSSFYH